MAAPLLPSLSTTWKTAPFQLKYSSKSKVKITLRLTVSQSVSLGVESHLGLMTRYLLLFDSYGLVFVERPLWREDGSVFCQRSLSRVRVPWYSRPYFTVSDRDFPFRRLLRLVGSRWRYWTLPPHGFELFLSWVEFYVTTDGQSASLSWYKAPIWGFRPYLY
jgi:hypothetical protein